MHKVEQHGHHEGEHERPSCERKTKKERRNRCNIYTTMREATTTCGCLRNEEHESVMDSAHHTSPATRGRWV